jgi:hypothetical protein
VIIRAKRALPEYALRTPVKLLLNMFLLSSFINNEEKRSKTIPIMKIPKR